MPDKYLDTLGRLAPGPPPPPPPPPPRPPPHPHPHHPTPPPHTIRAVTKQIPMLVAGEWVHGDEKLEVHHPYDGSLVETTTYATKAQVEAAVAAADGVRAEAERLPIHVRAEALAAVSRQIQERADEIAELITAENGKPLLWAKGEV